MSPKRWKTTITPGNIGANPRNIEANRVKTFFRVVTSNFNRETSGESGDLFLLVEATFYYEIRDYNAFFSCK